MNVFALILSFVLFVGGLLLMGYADQFAPGLEAPGFFGGIIAVALAFGLPAHVWTRTR